jgi:osmotically-inducible protein OsmY
MTDENSTTSPREGIQRPNQTSAAAPNAAGSADDLRHAIRATLAGNSELDAGGIIVQVSGGKVTLSGKVAERLEKRLAEALAKTVDGVTDVDNRLEVALANDTSPTFTRIEEGRESPPSP